MMAAMSWLTSPEAWLALLTLTLLEVVLGIDNVVFITVLAGRLPPEQRARARTLGLAGAMLTRIALLFSIQALSTLTAPLFRVGEIEVAGRNLVFAAGGLFLLAKATQEIHHRLEGEEASREGRPTLSLTAVVAQIMLLDVVFSLDSVVTAVGMAEHLAVMVIAIVVAVLLMMVAAGAIGDFVERHPTVRMLALSFLLLIGLSLVADGLGQHIPKGYLYFAIGFSLFVEMLNLRSGARGRPVRLRPRVPPGEAPR